MTTNKITKLNFDKWKPTKGNNVLFVTGLSGSGKSTYADDIAEKRNAEMFEIDWLDHLDSDKLKDNSFIKDLKKSGEKKYGLRFDRVLKKMYDNPSKLFVLEGIQLTDILNGTTVKNFNIKDKPVAILDTNRFISMYRTWKRSSGNGKVEWRKELMNDFPGVLKFYNDHAKQLNKFKKDITRR